MSRQAEQYNLAVFLMESLQSREKQIDSAILLLDPSDQIIYLQNVNSCGYALYLQVVGLYIERSFLEFVLIVTVPATLL